jgi:ribose transport system ATP-binding protein
VSEYIVELKNITKRFPGVVALRNMSLQIIPGEIHGLIGENGAGKSTLIKILTGVHKPDVGEIWIEGQKKILQNPVDALNSGVACVYQELNIVKLLSITDNIFMGRAIKNKMGLLDYETMHKEAREAMIALGHDIDTKTQCGKLGMGLQQMVEIGKSIQSGAKIVIMDEPTSSLSGKEVAQLMETIKKLKAAGVSILFVSHKLEELFKICDRVTVMRDGEHILTDDMENVTNDILITAMVGRTLNELFPKIFCEKGKEALRVEGLCEVGLLHDVSFSAYNGQILAFAGLVGAGRTETMRAIFGADKPDSGEVYVHGKKVSNRTPEEAVKNGMAFLTEDRKGQGLVLSQPVRTNLILSSMRKFSKMGILLNKKIEKTGLEHVKRLQIKTPNLDTIVVQLSGGNQQKVVIGKWVNASADIYIFDEPTRGIDVGAKVEVYNVMNKLVKEGKCVILVSSELPEILGMSDRVIVMRGGKITAEIERDSEHFNQESIMRAAWGGGLS